MIFAFIIFSIIHHQTEPNTFQAVLATDGSRSYAIYTYECGKLNWVLNLAGIGFSASSDFFAEHPLSRNSSVTDIACINEDSIPPSNWSNIVYKISNNGHVNCYCIMPQCSSFLIYSMHAVVDHM